MNQRTQLPHDRTVRRACLPEVLLSEDVALALGISTSAARKRLRRGHCGAYLRVGRRLAVRREVFLEALRRIEIRPILPSTRKGGVQ